MSNRRGFTLIEVLICLCVLCSLMPLTVQLVNIMTSRNFTDPSMQDEISLAQLRRVVNVCYDKKVSFDSIECVYENNLVILKVSKDYVYLTPGTWIFINDFERVNFELKEDLIWIIINRNNCERRAILGVK